MKTKTLPEEKKWLLHHLANSINEQHRFIELASPILGVFAANNLTKDHYCGYAAEMWLFKPQSTDHENEFALINQSQKTDSNGWLFFPSLICDDDCYVVKDGILMKHHLFSFLWFKHYDFKTRPDFHICDGNVMDFIDECDSDCLMIFHNKQQPLNEEIKNYLKGFSQHFSEGEVTVYSNNNAKASMEYVFIIGNESVDDWDSLPEYELTIALELATRLNLVRLRIGGLVGPLSQIQKRIESWQMNNENGFTEIYLFDGMSD